MGRLNSLFGFLVKVLGESPQSAAAQLPGPGKWRRIQHPAKCSCPENARSCSNHKLRFCKRHRFYVCENCGGYDRETRVNPNRIGNSIRLRKGQVDKVLQSRAKKNEAHA